MLVSVHKNMLVSDGGVPLNIIHLLRIFRTNSLDRLTGNRGDDGFDHQIGGLPVFFPKNPIPRYANLVGGLEHEFYDFPYIGINVIIPTDELIFFRGVGIPWYTTNQ